MNPSTTSAANADKVFILGLDGATFDLMMPFVQQGHLPTFAKLLDGGAYAPLNSTILSNSAPAWTSFATGKNPGKHSISGFTQLVPHSYTLRLLNGGDNKARTLWDILGAAGRRVIVANIPMTFPPKPVHGYLISGLDAPGLQSNFTFPAALREEILQVAPDYKITLHLGGYLQSERRRREALKLILASIEARCKVVRYLMQAYPWDFFAVRFNNPDTVQHQFWRFMDATHPDYDPKAPEEFKTAILTVYKALDDAAAQIIAQLPPDATLIVMSDHGAGPRTNKAVRLNEWLGSLGYLSIASNDDSRPLIGRSRALIRHLMERGLALLLRTLPAEVKVQIMRRLPRAVSKTWTYFRFPDIDWVRTKAFVGEIEGIRINLQGVYPKGVVKAEEYEPQREYLIGELKKLHDPATNEPIFQQVVKREEVFSGPYLKYLPDILAITVKDQYSISTRVSRQAKWRSANGSFIRTEDHWRKISGSHRREGIFLMKGPHIRAGVALPAIDIVDILPTILYQFGLPVPVDVDGRVVAELFAPAFVEGRPIGYETVAEPAEIHADAAEIYSADDYAQRLDHLRGLGYIE